MVKLVMFAIHFQPPKFNAITWVQLKVHQWLVAKETFSRASLQCYAALVQYTPDFGHMSPQGSRREAGRACIRDHYHSELAKIQLPLYRLGAC